jgi:alkylhydroperoxidase/carboxymuconolactone decarboxylase family protein YurZ
MSLTPVQQQLKDRFLAARGQWSAEWEAILRLKPQYFDSYLRLQASAQVRTRLPPKIQEFINIAVAACTTHIHAPAIRAHIQSARALGATHDEISEVIGLTFLVGIHTVTLGAPLLMELMDELGISKASLQSEELDQERARIKADFISRRGFWTDTWNPLLELDPLFFESYVDFSALASGSRTLEPKYREIVICAFDAATTHLYGRGTKIHMRNALQLGATAEEVMEMLEITSLMGIDGVTTGLGQLMEEANTTLA